MKQIEAKQLIPEISHVKYAGGKYRVAEIKTMPGNAIFIGIYDEPPSLHVDYLNADNVEFVKEWLDESPTSTDTGQRCVNHGAFTFSGDNGNIFCSECGACIGIEKPVKDGKMNKQQMKDYFDAVDKMPMPSPPIFKNLTEFQKRQLACEAHFSGAYQSICRENPMWDFSDGSGFTIRSTDRNYSDVIVKYHNLSKAQKLLLESFMEERNPPTAHTEELSECYFTPDKKTSSATICANCGKEKMLHTIGDGLKATSIEINPKPVTEELSTPPVREVKSVSEILKKHINWDKTDLRFASIKHFAESGNISGSLYIAICAAMEEYASQFTPHKEGYSVEGWVRVEDGLPEVEEHVIIKCTNHRVCTTGYIHERGYWIISNGNGSTYKQNDMHTITHWQPLPQPPTKKHT